MKRTLITTMLMILICTGCGAKESAVEVEQPMAEQQEAVNVEETQATDAQPQGYLECGQPYHTDELSYNILGVQANAYSGGQTFLLVKLEIRNNTDEGMTYTPMDKLTLFDASGNEYMIDLFADVETGLGNNIPKGGKIMGDVAFEITESKDEDYTLHIGKSYAYKPAFHLSVDQIGETFAEQFESNGIETEYTLGIPVESEQLTILLTNASITESNKEGLDQLNCEMEIKNNSTETQNFMLGLNMVGAYTAGGQTLDSRSAKITLPVTVEPGETISGVVPYYIPQGERAFYIAIKPDLNDFQKVENISFEVE